MRTDASGLQWTSDDFWDHYNNGGGAVSLSGVGLMDAFLGASSVQGAQSRVLAGYKNMLHSELKKRCTGCNLTSEYSFDAHQFDESYDVTGDPGLRVVGNGEIFNKGKCHGFMDCGTGMWFGTCDLHFYVRDWFKDPWDYFDIIPGEIETGTPYRINADWNVSESW